MIRSKLINYEKPYITISNYLKAVYGKKVYKVSLNGGFTCPNRDGTISSRGCLFCSASGSGDFAGKKDDDIKTQFEKVKNLLKDKWNDGYYIAYFQANTNTYGTIEQLKKVYYQVVSPTFLLDENIKILSIATRPDCLDDEVLALLKELSTYITLWIELGFQTSNEKTASFINRGYNNEVLVQSVKKLNKIGLKPIIHIINGLPGETEADMLNTIHFLNKLDIDGIKIHMLHLTTDSPLGKEYLKNPFKLLSLEEYRDIVVKQIRILRDDIIIHRLTGDANKDTLIEPTWTLKKFVVINEIDKELRRLHAHQGDLYVKDYRD